MPARPARTVASTQLPVPMRLAESPIRAAPCSFSAAARVARPNRVTRYVTDSAIASTITIPDTQNRSGGTGSPARLTGLDGRIVGVDFGVVPKLRTAIA